MRKQVGRWLSTCLRTIVCLPWDIVYVADDFVFDAQVGVGVSPDADDFFSGIGGGYGF